jgi:hypothetical protein
MENITKPPVGKFDGVYTLENSSTVYRIAKVTSENKGSLKRLLHESHHSIIDSANDGEYLLENPNNPNTYEIIGQDSFNTFSKMSHEQAKKLLNGGLC